MTPRKFSLFAAASALALIPALFTCEKVPDYCSSGEVYDPTCQFCFGGSAYNMCGGKKYNPLTAGCDKDTLVGTRCSNDSVVPLGTPCGGYTLIFASAPELGGRLEPLTPPDNGLTYDAKQTVLLQASANPDYKFAGWAGAQPAEKSKNDVTVTAEYVTSGNIPKVTIVAMFKPIGKGKLITDVFPKTPTPGGSVFRNKPEPEDGYKDGEEVTVTAQPAAGFAFAGWSGAESSKNNTAVITMDESKTLVAMFAPVVYTLNARVSPAGGGAVFIDGTPFGGAFQDVGTKITVWAKGNEGYEFAGWSGVGAYFDDGTSAATTVTLNADAEITASFKPGGGGGAPGAQALVCTLKVNINTGDGGSVLLDPPGGICRLGGEITAAAAPNEGYSFTGWSGDTSGSANPVTVYMGRNKTVTANFQNNGTAGPTDTTGGGGQTAPDTARVPFVVNVDATVNAERVGGGSSSSMPAPLSVRGGAVDTMRIPLQGGGGESWKISVSAAATGYVDTAYTFSVAKGVNALQNITLRVATVTPTTYTLTVLSAGTGATGTGSYAAGATVTISAGTAPTGQRFKNWTSSSNGVTFANANSATTMFIMPANAVTVSAVFGQQVVEYGTLIDNRDGQTYKTVIMPDGKTWMAENLNYNTADGFGSWCYENMVDSCNKYGRLYDWATAMGIDVAFNSTEWNIGDNKHQGICPDSWHLPSDAEWQTLVNSAGGYVADSALKSTDGWTNNGNGTNSLGFLALPGGLRTSDGYFVSVGCHGTWWTATDRDGRGAYSRGMYCNYDGVGYGDNGKEYGYAIRCVQDD